MNGVDDDDVDGSDFGFLSDQRLLNTAMTRAQSLVGVVGDPIALCAIGNCMNVWRAYLKHCSQMHSILPQPFSFNDIKAQVSLPKISNKPMFPLRFVPNHPLASCNFRFVGQVSEFMSLTRAGESPMYEVGFSSDADQMLSQTSPSGVQGASFTPASAVAPPTVTTTQPKFEYASVLKGEEKKVVRNQSNSSTPSIGMTSSL